MKRTARFGAFALALALGAAACGSDDKKTDSGGATTTAAKADKVKVAFVYIGPATDAGWTKRHDDGRKAMLAKLGDKVDAQGIENVPDSAESETRFEQLARDGYKLIFATSFGYGKPMEKVAAKYPDVCFEWATGFETKPNMGTYFGAAEEARYLSGIAAAKASKTGKLGYVAAFGIPEVLRGINAFTLGARSVNPAATVKVVWTSTWFNPSTEKTAAQSLLDSGVDVLAQHQDSPATGQAAEAKGAKWVGYNDDMSSQAPDAWLTGPVWDWSKYYTDTTQSVLDGKCPTDQYYGDMKDGLVGLAPFGTSVDDATKALIETKKAEIIAGTFKPFTGPISDNKGKVVVAAGKTATLTELLSTDYLVDGVIGEIPKS